jgi:outer membrane lipoprotein-sorting protein
MIWSGTTKALIFAIFCLGAQAEKDPLAEVRQVLAKYRQASAFQAEVSKTVENSVIGSKASATGKFYFSKGKVRLVMGEPENTTVVYDGSNIWMETRLDETTVEVTKIQSKEVRKNDSLIALLFDRKDILSAFDFKAKNSQESTQAYRFVPKKTARTELTSLVLELDAGELSRVSYSDDRENTINFKFKSIQRGSVPAKHFSYKPPKGANVTVIR